MYAGWLFRNKDFSIGVVPHGGGLIEDAGREDYDLRFTATLARWILPDGTDDALRGDWES